jgi:SCP-2 sterol transfer family protein
MPQFLTDEWVTRARQLRQELDGQLPPSPVPARINLVVTDVPFGPGELPAHLDTTKGFELDTGHLDDPEVTLTLGYALAKELLVEGNLQAGMQAFMAGQLKVEGDMTKLMGLQTQLVSAPIQPLTSALKEITD